MQRVRLALTFCSVVIASNCCQPAMAQAPPRFIQQPKTSKPQTATVEAGAKTKAESLQFNEQAVASERWIENQGRVPHSFPTLRPDTLGSTDLNFDGSDSRPTVPADALSESKPNGAKFPASALSLDSNRNAANSPAAGLQIGRSQNQNSGASQSSPKSLQWISRRADSNSNSQTHSESDPYRSERVNQAAIAMPNALPASPGTDRVNSLSEAATQELLSKIETRMESIEASLAKAGEPAQQARIKGTLVSNRIVSDPNFAINSADQTNVGRIDMPQGWQAIGERLTAHISKCESLLSRGAYFSGREEAETACLLLIRHIDLHDNRFRSEPAWNAANKALRESEHFMVMQRAVPEENVLRRLIDSHETPVLKGQNLAETSPLIAAQHYQLFAEQELVIAAQGHPWASELFYTVGRTYEIEAEEDPSRVDALRSKAMAFYRAARVTLPSNAVACNQIGYLLLKMDRAEDAREALVAAVQLNRNDVAYLCNLAEASRRLGDNITLDWASQSIAMIRSRTPMQMEIPPVIEISAEAFASVSPRESGPKSPLSGTSADATQATSKSAAAPSAMQRR